MYTGQGGSPHYLHGIYFCSILPDCEAFGEIVELSVYKVNENSHYAVNQSGEREMVSLKTQRKSRNADSKRGFVEAVFQAYWMRVILPLVRKAQ